MKDKKSRQNIDDPRFSGYKDDPRWKSVPKNMRKVEIDDRFKGIFTEKGFTKYCLFFLNNGFNECIFYLFYIAKIDQYGRETKGSDSTSLLKKLYKVDSDEIAPHDKFAILVWFTFIELNFYIYILENVKDFQV